MQSNESRAREGGEQVLELRRNSRSKLGHTSDSRGASGSASRYQYRCDDHAIIHVFQVNRDDIPPPIFKTAKPTLAVLRYYRKKDSSSHNTVQIICIINLITTNKELHSSERAIDISTHGGITRCAIDYQAMSSVHGTCHRTTLGTRVSFQVGKWVFPNYSPQ
jgi:hypothetical protein